MSVREPMQFQEVDIADLPGILSDPAWVLEQKFDGTRGLAVVGPKAVWFPGRGGVGALGHTAAIQHLPAINADLLAIGLTGTDEMVLDGEIMCGTGEYRIFDLAYLRVAGVELVKSSTPFSVRRQILEGLPLPVQGRTCVVRQARSTEDKLALLNSVRDGGGEGVMAKQVDSLYQPGARVKTILKLKFVKTGDVVVMDVNRPDPKHGSFTLGAYDETGTLVTVGACSAIGKDPETKVGDVIEVAYLYFTGSSVYQPRMIKRRPDKQPKDCLTSQFPAYSREAR